MPDFMTKERNTNCRGLASRLRHELEKIRRGIKDCDETKAKLVKLEKKKAGELAGVEFELSRLAECGK